MSSFGKSSNVDDEPGDRLWMKADGELRNQGYREGLAEGEEATLQEGFNLGYAAASTLCHALSSIRGLLSGHLVLAETNLGETELTGTEKEAMELLQSRAAELETETSEVLNRWMQNICLSDSIPTTPGSTASGDHQDDLKQLYAKLKVFAAKLGVLPRGDSKLSQADCKAHNKSGTETAGLHGGSCGSASCCHGADTSGQPEESECCGNASAALRDSSGPTPEEVKAALSLMMQRLVDLAELFMQAVDKDPRDWVVCM